MSPTLGIGSVQALVAHAKAKPEQCSLRSWRGIAPHSGGGDVHRSRRRSADPYADKGNNEAIADLLGGRIGYLSPRFQPSAELMKAGQIKALAVGSIKRSAIVPELPTLAEAGINGFDAVIWYGLLAPKQRRAPSPRLLPKSPIA